MPIINTVIKGGGTTPTGTVQITTNGTHDVSAYANADVQVPTTAPALYRELKVAANGKLTSSTTATNFSLGGATDLQEYVFANAYANNYGITSFDMSSLTTISGNGACYRMFYGSGVTDCDLSSLTTISGENVFDHAFQNSPIANINISSLTTVSGTSGCNSMFFSCRHITSVDVSSLTTISGSSGCQAMFGDCDGLTSVVFSSLTSINNISVCREMFYGCNNLTTLYFPSITPASFGTRTNQFLSMCGNVPDITIHFPSNVQTQVSALSGYSTTAPFGATSGTVLFDLPATNTLTGADTVTYTRNPKYDTGTALAWKVGAYGTTNFTPAYYTSGTTDPAVGDTIYSDSACTTAVTTIDSIA